MHNNELFSAESNPTGDKIKNFFSSLPETGLIIKGVGANIGKIKIKEFYDDPLLSEAIRDSETEITLSEVFVDRMRLFEISIPKKSKNSEELKKLAQENGWTINYGKNFLVFEHNDHSLRINNPDPTIH